MNTLIKSYWNADDGTLASGQARSSFPATAKDFEHLVPEKWWKLKQNIAAKLDPNLSATLSINTIQPEFLNKVSVELRVGSKTNTECNSVFVGEIKSLLELKLQELQTVENRSRHL